MESLMEAIERTVGFEAGKLSMIGPDRQREKKCTCAPD
jgi:hypothetical protein